MTREMGVCYTGETVGLKAAENSEPLAAIKIRIHSKSYKDEPIPLSPKLGHLPKRVHQKKCNTTLDWKTHGSEGLKPCGEEAPKPFLGGMRVRVRVRERVGVTVREKRIVPGRTSVRSGCPSSP